MNTLGWDQTLQWPVTPLASLETSVGVPPDVMGGVTSFFAMHLPDETQAEQWQQVQERSKRGRSPIASSQTVHDDDDEDEDGYASMADLVESSGEEVKHEDHEGKDDDEND